MADLAPKLSEDLERFANEMEHGGLDGFEWTPEGIAHMASAIARTFRMFAIDARLLEAKLDAAACRIEALNIHVYLGAHFDAAIHEGARAGKVIDLREIFLDEHGFNAKRRARPTSDGDAA